MQKTRSKPRPLVIGHLVAKLPIIQGGMGIGVSLSRLASAVAANGGVGIISAAQIGFNDIGFEENPIQTNLKALSKHLRLAKKTANGGIVGVNIMTATNQYEDYVKQAVKSKADLVISGAGLPLNLPDLVKNSQTLIAPIVSSAKAAKVLLNVWAKNYGVTADFIVVEGPKAGGHLGFKITDLEQPINFDQELVQIISFIKETENKFKKKIPIIFGGGIYDHNDVSHYLNLGCDGVQVATPFVTTKECDADYRYKQAYLNVNEEDICIIQSPVGMPGRAIRNKFLQSITDQNAQYRGKCFRCLSRCNRPNIPYCITDRLIRAVKGDVENGLIFCGENAHRIKEMSTVQEVLQSLFPQSFRKKQRETFLEIENILTKHPAVHQCAVIGIKDTAGMPGIAAKAYVVLTNKMKAIIGTASEKIKELRKELQDFIIKKTASHESPKILEFYDHLPKTVNGKINRKGLKLC